MRLKRKKVGSTIYLDKETKKVVFIEPKYDFVLVESDLKRLLTYDKFYISLIFPILLTTLLFLVESKPFVVAISMLLGLSLSLTIKSIVEIFNEP